jgi:hypothetical protein
MTDQSGVDVLVAKDAIRGVVHRYSRAIESRQMSRFGELFSTDCHLDYGQAMGGPVDGREAILQRFTGGSDGSARKSLGIVATSHHNANVLIGVIDPDHAQAITTCTPGTAVTTPSERNSVAFTRTSSFEKTAHGDSLLASQRSRANTTSMSPGTQFVDPADRVRTDQEGNST